MKFFKFECEYYINYEDDNEKACGIVTARDYCEAIEKMADRFPHIVSVYMEEWDQDSDFIFIDEQNYEIVCKIMDGEY